MDRDYFIITGTVWCVPTTSKSLHNGDHGIGYIPLHASMKKQLLRLYVAITLATLRMKTVMTTSRATIAPSFLSQGAILPNPGCVNGGPKIAISHSSMIGCVRLDCWFGCESLLWKRSGIVG